MKTRITDLFGIQYPIIQGAMQWLSKPKLAAAVSNAGGLGTINMTTYDTPEAFQQDIQLLKTLTDKPFCVNLSLLPDTKPDGPIKGFLQAITEEKVRIVETAGSSPKPFMDTLKGAGCLVMHKIPDSRFAHTAQEVGCDAVCIVGYEGGGHPGMAGVGSLVQWPLTTERCTLPVVGAGGVCDGRTLYAALAAGLDGVMVGTRFLMAQETDIGPRLRQTVIDARETDTVLTQTSIRNALRSLKTQGALDIIAFEQHHPTFDELYPLIRGTVTKAAYEQDAEDAVHDAFLSVAEHIKKFSRLERHKTKAFLVTIVENKAIDLYRKKTHRKEEILWEETTGLAPAYEPEDGLTRCILKLPARYREFLRLKHELGYSTKEVAELMGISWPAARKLEQRARDRLEELCREEGIL